MNYQVGDVVEVSVLDGSVTVLMHVTERRRIIKFRHDQDGNTLPEIDVDEPGFQGVAVYVSRPDVAAGTHHTDSSIIRIIGPEEAAPVLAEHAERVAAQKAKQAESIANWRSPEAIADREVQEREAARIPPERVFVVYPLKTLHIDADNSAVSGMVGWEGFGLCGRHFKAGEPASSIRPLREQGRFCHSCGRRARAKGYELPDGWGG